MTPLVMARMLLLDAFWSAVAAVGFAVLFNVPRKALPGCALTGALGHTLRTLFIWQGVPLEAATLLGATAVGFLSEYLGRRYKSPRLVFAVPGVIPMVPGILAFSTMLGVFDLLTAPAADQVDVLVNTAVMGVQMGLVLAALALGIIAPNLLFHRREPVV